MIKLSVIFNHLRFYQDLNRTRVQRGNMAWNKVATRIGVTPSLLSTYTKQFEQSGSRPKTLSLETTVRLLHWMKKTDVAEYLLDEDATNGNV